MGGTESDIVIPVMDARTAEEEFGCSSCGRLVCDVCAVVGERGRESGWGKERHWGSESERECLSCAIDRGKKGVKWVGGIGWMP